jgi:hypothetical protein
VFDTYKSRELDPTMHVWRLTRMVRRAVAVGFAGGALMAIVAVRALLTTEMPPPWGPLSDLAHLRLPEGPRSPGPAPTIVLSPTERVAIEALRLRGASITVFTTGKVLVHFPLGQDEREWRKEGMPMVQCGMGIAHSFSPDASGPPMTDRDLVRLDQLPTLERVNLAGTQVTRAAIARFRETHGNIEVEDHDLDAGIK